MNGYRNPSGRYFLLSSLCLCVSVVNTFAQDAYVQRPRALLVNFDPVIETRSNQRLHTVGGWNDPSTLTSGSSGYISDFATVSHGLLMYRLTQKINADVWPIKADGFRYTDASYLQCLSTWSGWHTPDICDYKAFARDYDLARKVDFGEIDEVLNHSAPYFGGWETHMLGRGGYWCNSGPEPRIACSRIFIVSVFNYERGVGEMLEDFGHRSESILRYVYGSWSAQETHAWNRFSLYDKELPGKAECGNVHFAPNSQSDYDWGNATYVDSTADYWLNVFPAGYPSQIASYKRSMNDSEWGNGDIRLHHKWWFNHFPHAAGSITEYGMTRLNNWWAYVQDFNRYPESNGDHAPGGTPPTAGAYPIPARAVTANSYDDWSPQINASGRMVWQGYDGSDFEIYSANASGGTTVRITNNGYSDESPKINSSGRIVWQAFDGQDYEIFSANADGTGLVQITNNTTNDWHPEINDSGRIVWDSWDGEDYEIWSANADGTDKRQITNNTSGGVGYPREDVWPKINNNGRVVWFGYDGTNWEIFSANWDGSNLVNVSNNSYENEYPEINDAGQVVWHAWLSDTNSEIYTAPATGGTARRVTNNTFEDWYPQINATGTIVWMSRNATGHWQIATAAASGGSVTYLTSSSTHNQYPRIASTGQVVWQGFDGNDWEIYSWKQGTIQKVSDNNYDDRAPVVNANGQIAWHGAGAVNSGVDSTEIYVTSVPLKTADLDGDNDVDVDDLAIFIGCMTGAGVPQTDQACQKADMDSDGDVDQDDYGDIQVCFSGPRILPPDGC